jgi:hypothetical protein
VVLWKLNCDPGRFEVTFNVMKLQYLILQPINYQIIHKANCTL